MGPLLGISYTHPFSSLSFQVRVQRGADQRGARRMCEGHMDASGFIYASADVFCYSLFFIVRSSHGYNIWVVILCLMI